jgi:hypothetical protein
VDNPKNAFTVLFPREEMCPGQVAERPDPKLPDWKLTPAVINAVKRLSVQVATEKDPAKAQGILDRLTLDQSMQDVWKELYKKKRVNHRTTGEFHYPAYIRYASRIPEYQRRACELRKKGGRTNEQEARILEMEAAAIEGECDPLADQPWSDQDLAVQLFLWHVYENALHSDPVYLSEMKAQASKLRETANRLRQLPATLQSLGVQSYAVSSLEDFASACDGYASMCDDKASTLDVDPRVDDPWIITRRRGDAQLRTFVVNLSIISETLFGDTLCGTVAIVTNVVFSRKVMTRSKVREMIRLPQRSSTSKSMAVGPTDSKTENSESLISTRRPGARG